MLRGSPHAAMAAASRYADVALRVRVGQSGVRAVRPPHVRNDPDRAVLPWRLGLARNDHRNQQHGQQDRTDDDPTRVVTDSPCHSSSPSVAESAINAPLGDLEGSEPHGAEPVAEPLPDHTSPNLPGSATRPDREALNAP